MHITFWIAAARLSTSTSLIVTSLGCGYGGLAVLMCACSDVLYRCWLVTHQRQVRMCMWYFSNDCYYDNGLCVRERLLLCTILPDWYTCVLFGVRTIHRNAHKRITFGFIATKKAEMVGSKKNANK